MQFFSYTLILPLIDRFWIMIFFQSYTIGVYRYLKNSCVRILYYNICKSLSTGLSTLEAQIWGFHKHAPAQTKKGFAYKIKRVYKDFLVKFMTSKYGQRYPRSAPIASQRIFLILNGVHNCSLQPSGESSWRPGTRALTNCVRCVITCILTLLKTIEK